MKGAETVVVGAGAAGAVVAARVSENPARQVLLVEAGPDYPHPSLLPPDLADGTRNSLSAHDWGLAHRRSPRSRLRMPFPRGRVVGGSSAVNTCIALRGMPYDFDEWGLAEWTWEKCLPAFRKLERDLDFGDAPWHGSDGPLPLRRHRPEELCPWSAAFLEAAGELGFASVDDHNAPGATGAGPHAMNKLAGRRISAAEAWLDPEVRARDTLTIQAETLARRVLFDGSRVVGLEVQTQGKIERIATRRVVLCAGAVFTPGILLRSGVGPREDVARIGVDLVRDSPLVGARLLDHPGSAFFLAPRRAARCRSGDPVIQVALRCTASADGRPNSLQLQAGNCVPNKWVDLPVLALMISVGKPRGAGRLRYTSARAEDRPRITSDFYQDPHDRKQAVEALHLQWRLSRRPGMRKLARVLWPPPRVLSSPQRLLAWLPQITDSSYHPCGTVPMGDTPASGAVDPRGRVWDLEGLHVADASLMPTIPSGNIHLPTLMIAERCGEWLAAG